MAGRAIVATPKPSPNAVMHTAAAASDPATRGKAAAPTAWTVNTAAVTTVIPCRRARPVVTKRPVTDSTPSSPATVAATVAGYPAWRRYATSNTPTADTAAAWATNATV